MFRIERCFASVLAVFFGLCSAALAAPPDCSPAPSAEMALRQATAGARPYARRAWLRERIVTETNLARYGLHLDEDWELRDGARPVVVLVHGFNSSPAQNAAMLRMMRAAGYPCGSFAYPNDHAILPSAELLSRELGRFAQRHPGRRIVLVCHSMGGVVARACLEDPRWDPGNVDRLIMIAPPTHGTLVAHFAVGTDLYEHWISRRSDGPWVRMRDSVIDGLGEAADDLCPGSEFLEGLNGRPRNASVQYSILLGSGAPIAEEQVVWIRDSVCGRLAGVPLIDGSAERMRQVLDDLDELVDGRGDGVVAIKRGRLAGVSDTRVMAFGHVAVTREPRDAVVREVHRAVLSRLE